MILYVEVNEIISNNIYFSDIIKNTVIENGKFIRLIYSSSSVILNGIYINIPFIINKSSCNKYYFNFCDINDCKKNLLNIENLILNKYNTQKNKIYKLAQQLDQNTIKLFNYVENYNKIILKISGLWEDENNYGLTYKFICHN